MDMLIEAKEFLQEARDEFEKGKKENNRILIRDACEKGWNATILATNTLILIKEGKKTKSHWERRKSLDELEKKDKAVENKTMSDRFMARAHYLHEEGFYAGNIDLDRLEIELEKVEKYIKDVEELIKE